MGDKGFVRYFRKRKNGNGEILRRKRRGGTINGVNQQRARGQQQSAGGKMSTFVRLARPKMCQFKRQYFSVVTKSLTLNCCNTDVCRTVVIAVAIDGRPQSKNPSVPLSSHICPSRMQWIPAQLVNSINHIDRSNVPLSMQSEIAGCHYHSRNVGISLI